MQRLGRKEEEWFNQELVTDERPQEDFPVLVVSLWNSNPQSTQVEGAADLHSFKCPSFLLSDDNAD